jgi:hypothetical protein
MIIATAATPPAAIHTRGELKKLDEAPGAGGGVESLVVPVLAVEVSVGCVAR